jgi:hypothetical protein
MKLIFSSLFLTIGIACLAQDPTPQNCQLSTVVQVDGHGDEWPMTYLQDEDKKFFYNVCTDETSIYIRLRIKEELVRRKVGLFGLTVWLDPNGKKKKKLGLHFPSGTEAKDMMDAFEKVGDNKNMSSSKLAEFQKEMDRKLIENLEVLELIGLTDEPLTSTRSGITNGIKVAIAQDDEGAYVYEAIIPFKSYRLSKASISALGVGFETGYYVPPKPKTSNVPPPPGPGGVQRPNPQAQSNYYRGTNSTNPMGYATSFWASINFKK